MKNTDSLQIFAVVAIVLIVGLLIAIWVPYKNYQPMMSLKADAEARAAHAQKTKAELANKCEDLIRKISGQSDTELDAIKSNFEDDSSRFMNTAPVTERNYRLALLNLAVELETKQDELEKLTENNAAIQAKLDSDDILFKLVYEAYEREKNNAETILRKAKGEFDDTRDKANTARKLVKDERDSKVGRLEGEIKTLATNKGALEGRLTTTANELSKVFVEKQELLRPRIDRLDGRVVSINQLTGEVIINLGSEDGLATKMTFSVYAPTVTGISLTTDDIEKGAVICDICERDRIMRRTKGSIEIIRVEPHQAVARKLNDVLVDPIVAGDGIYTPLWNPGQPLRFALGAGMRLPGLGQRTDSVQLNDLAVIRQIIATGGGIVDCYISDGSEEGSTAGELVGELSMETNFFVVGNISEKDNKEQDTVMSAHSELKKSASQSGVITITLKDLITRMGWANVTPIRGFGSYAQESDHRIVPSGVNPPSNGIVSPLYQLENKAARVRARDRGQEVANGAVSGLYTEGASRPISTGATSEIFSPRSPSNDFSEGTP